MKLVILAAGKGTRFYPLTRNLPKGLVPLLDKTLIEYVIEPYLGLVSEIILVINPATGHMLKERFCSSYLGHPVSYVIQDDAATPELKGTWGALWHCRDLLCAQVKDGGGDNRGEAFCVSNCDDLLLQSDIASAFALGVPVMGLARARMPWNYLSIDADAAGFISGFRRHVREGGETIDVCTSNGFYVLTPDVFSFKPVAAKDGELGLPHTMLEHAAGYPLRAFEFSAWQAVNGPDNIPAAEEFVRRIKENLK